MQEEEGGKGQPLSRPVGEMLKMLFFFTPPCWPGTNRAAPPRKEGRVGEGGRSKVEKKGPDGWCLGGEGGGGAGLVINELLQLISGFCSCLSENVCVCMCVCLLVCVCVFVKGQG